MRIKARNLGTKKTVRNILKPDIIKCQGLDIQGHTIREAAVCSLLADAVEGRGPLAQTLKKEAQALEEKFTKANPDFAFFVTGRPVGYSPLSKKQPEAPAKSTKASKTAKVEKPTKATKPAKVSKAKAFEDKPAKPAKAGKTKKASSKAK